MSDDDNVLAYERVLNLVSDAQVAALRGVDPNVAAVEIVELRRPTARELATARHENQEAHGGGMPEILRGIVAPAPITEDEARMRRMIDDILVAAERRLPSAE
ncbi:hypothetical protein [Arthrobacter sp. GAS37]|uniref:hypothetical protein n=1 Tax=Arthrobacter sp. GAS37 TaxID=3156261 RepID=UPI00385015FB